MAVRELTWVDRAGVPMDRDLDPTQLEALANHIAAHPEQWAEHIAFDSEERVYVSLHRDHHVDVWLLCWTPENDTGWHDHDVSSGAVAVAQGRLVEHNLALGTAARSVSLHAYSPPLVRLGQYSFDRTGLMRRLVVAYTEELGAA